MAQYFFNLVDGERLDDQEGQDFPDDGAALAEARRNALAIMAHSVAQGTLPLDESIEVVDADGTIIGIVAFIDLLTITCPSRRSQAGGNAG